MAGKQAAIGADVRTRDGKSIGKVEHIVFDSTTKSIGGVVADKGIFDEGHVIPIEHIASMTEDEIQLSITEAEALALPSFVEHEFFRFGDTMTMGGRSGGMVSSGGSGSWTHYGPGAGGLPSTGAHSFFEPAVVGDVQARVIGPLDESDIVIDNKTDVVTSDGDKIGVVDDFLLDDEGRITGFLVEQGFLFHHDVQIPIEWVAGITHDHIRLSVDKAKVESTKA